MATKGVQSIQNMCTAISDVVTIILSMWVVIERLYVRVTPRTEMCWDSFKAFYNG